MTYIDISYAHTVSLKELYNYIEKILTTSLPWKLSITEVNFIMVRGYLEIT